MAVDKKKLEQFLGQFVTDLGATVHAGMVVMETVLDFTRPSRPDRSLPRNWLP